MNYTAQEFLKLINRLRLDNKNKWYYWQGIVNNKQVSIKGHNTWLQIFDVNGYRCANNMGQSVTDYKSHIVTMLDRDDI